MDSISGPELSLKVHAFDGTVKGYGIKLRAAPRWKLLSALFWAWTLWSCSSDPHEVAGAMGLAAKAASEGDTDSLFWVVDERARHAMDGIVKARRSAEKIIVMSYPMELQGDAIAAFNGVAGFESGRELFQERCDQACLDWFSQSLSAPLTIRKEGNVAHVTTVRGTKVSLFRDKSGRYGISWNTKELARERTRAFAELALIERNAKEYARGRALH